MSRRRAQRAHGKGAARQARAVGEAQLDDSIHARITIERLRAQELKALQGALALVHAHQHEPGQKEGERKCQAVGVIQASDQHHEQQNAGGIAGTRRQDVEASSSQMQGEGIFSLTLVRPARDALDGA